jgi:hypothetical protein
MYENETLTDANFLIYCAKSYKNPQCQSTEEFMEDLKHIKYIKKLLTRYIEKGDLKERLILNHLMILNNLFGARHLPRILYLKLKPQYHCVKPFLVLLNIMPDMMYNIGGTTIIECDNIHMDERIIRELRKIKYGS